MVNSTAPSLSAAVIAFVALQEVVLPATVGTTVAVTVLMVTVGVPIGSSEVKLSVMISSRVALDVSELLDSMDTTVSIGGVVSRVG